MAMAITPPGLGWTLRQRPNMRRIAGSESGTVSLAVVAAEGGGIGRGTVGAGANPPGPNLCLPISDHAGPMASSR
jgi:hypothetical protein